jgi:hypothetical protein
MKQFLERRNQRLLSAYTELPSLLREHYGIEQTVLAGGYGYRQVMELIQNGADAILEGHEDPARRTGENRIHVLLREKHLYVANTGAPLSEDGVDALLSSHSSPKRGNQIGRFGLGFKSLLRLGGQIDLFTRASGALRFNPRQCQVELKNRFGVAEVPSLRLAWPLPAGERDRDEVLDLMPWAETIVRVEVPGSEIREHLREEIRGFPAEFLLFFPVPTVLIFDDGEGQPREIRAELHGSHQSLLDGAETSRWRVASLEVAISDGRALADATHIHARGSVPVAWAVPLESMREDAGRFWAFFPTHTPTYLPGILNAPWKLNSDRNAIIGGEWNSALMTEAAKLIAGALPSLASSGDPGRPLEAFPRRLDRKDEVAASLVEVLWTTLETAAVIPDGSGVLRPASTLLQHPRDNPKLVQEWQALAPAGELARFIHSSCLERQRSGRLGALAERLAETGTADPNLGRAEADAWFKSVASAEQAQAIKVLQLAEAYSGDCKPNEWSSVRPLLTIIPSQEGKLLPPDQVVLALDEAPIPGRAAVAYALQKDGKAKRILADVMKVRTPDDNVWVSVLAESLNIRGWSAHAQNAEWATFWSRLRAAPASAQQRFLAQYRGKVRVRRGDGTWVAPQAALLPGTLVHPEDSLGNLKLVVDQIHQSDAALLEALGVSQFPEGNLGPGKFNEIAGAGSELDEWLEACRFSYRSTHRNSALPGYLVPLDLNMPKGFAFLQKLRGTPNAKLTRAFLARMARGEFLQQLEFRHSTTQNYPKIDVAHPLPWFVLRYGTVQVGDSIVRLAALMLRRHEPAVSMLPDSKDLLAALEKLQQVQPPVSTSETDVRKLWLALIDGLAIPQALADDSLEALWAGAAKDKVAPEKIRTITGDIALTQDL